jgi:hypothetical protein
MATRRWLGAAADVKQIDTLEVTGTWAANDTLTLTINNITFVLTVLASKTTAQVATALKQAFNGETLTDSTDFSYTPSYANVIGVFAELVATVSSSTVTFTGRTAGVLVSMAASEGAAAGGITFTNVTVATGKNWFSNQDNWSGNAVPVDNDDIVFDSGNVNCTDGLSPAIQPATLSITKGYTGVIGRPDLNTSTSDALAYSEYRGKFLTFDNNSVTTTVDIGSGQGSGSGRIKLDFGAGQISAVVYGTGSRLIQGEPALVIKGTHASNAVTIQNGDVGLAYAEGDSTTVATLRVGTDTSSTAVVYVGNDVTLTTFISSGGTTTLRASSTTCTVHGGTVTQMEGVPTSLYVWGGVYYWQSTGTIGSNCSVGSGASLDRSKDNRAATITPVVNLYKGSSFRDPNATLTLTAGFKANGCKISECLVDVGSGRTFTVA